MNESRYLGYEPATSHAQAANPKPATRRTARTHPPIRRAA